MDTGGSATQASQPSKSDALERLQAKVGRPVYRDPCPCTSKHVHPPQRVQVKSMAREKGFASPVGSTATKGTPTDNGSAVNSNAPNGTANASVRSRSPLPLPSNNTKEVPYLPNPRTHGPHPRPIIYKSETSRPEKRENLAPLSESALGRLWETTLSRPRGVGRDTVCMPGGMQEFRQFKQAVEHKQAVETFRGMQSSRGMGNVHVQVGLGFTRDPFARVVRYRGFTDDGYT